MAWEVSKDQMDDFAKEENRLFYIEKQIEAIRDWVINSDTKYLIMQCHDPDFQNLRDAIKVAGYSFKSEKRVSYMGTAYHILTIERPKEAPPAKMGGRK